VAPTKRTIADNAAPLRYGNPLVFFDPKEERRLLWKIDLYIIPTVALLYLFCFIDRANVGMSKSTLPMHLSPTT
jgi:hypothetical protein